MEYVRTVTRELDVGPSAELSVELRSGSVSVRGDDVRSVHVEAVARLWADDDLEADEQAGLIDRGIAQDGPRVTVRAPRLLRPHPLFIFGRSPRIDYTIAVPHATNTRITSRSGRVAVERLRAPLEVDARSGRVNLRDIDGDVRATAASGGIQAEAIGGDADVESRSGSVRVAGCKGRVAVRARSGSVHVEDVAGELRIEARSGSVHYAGDVTGNIEIDLASGSMRLALNPDAGFFLDAESVSGSVHSDLDLKGGAAPPHRDAPTVRLRTGSGSILIGPR